MFKELILAILFWLIGLTSASFAAINLSVSPIDGGSALRFERTPVAGEENKKEIHIRVSSTNGDRYQVFQQVLEPMMDEKGDVLNLQAMETQTLPNSNSTGTLYLQNSDHLSMSDQLLYSSSQSGETDSFIVGYSINQNLIDTAGSFRGRLVFTVRGVGNAYNDQVTIDVFLKTGSGLKILVKGAHNPNWIRVKSSDTTERAADYVNVSFSGNSGRVIRIYQELEAPLQNEEDQELGANVLQLDAEGQTEGLRIQGLSSLGSGKTLIYSGDKDTDNFVIYFLVNTDQVQQQDAGVYRGRINYILETDHETKEFLINIQCRIPPIFSVNITTATGGVSFAHVLANSPPQEKEVLVTVLSNLHKPYQVFQDLQTNMTNTQGKEFDSKYFTDQVQIPAGQKGQTDLTEFSPVQIGEYPIFSSDSGGRGATFKVVYRLQGYDQMSPGDFSAPIRFSLNQK